MTEVRKHQRQTASGKRTTVKRHTRSGEKAQPEPKMTPREKWEFANEDPNSEDFGKSRGDWLASKRERAAPHVSSLTPAEPDAPAEEWWAEDDRPPPGEFWDEDDTGEDGGHLHPDWHMPEDEPAQAEPKTAKELRREAREAERAGQQVKLEKWEADMRADAERRGLPAYRPIGTKASWWRKRG